MVQSLEAWPCPAAPVFCFLQKVATIYMTGSRASLPPSNVKPMGLQIDFLKPTLAVRTSRDLSISDRSVSSGERAIPLLNCWTAVRLQWGLNFILQIRAVLFTCRADLHILGNLQPNKEHLKYFQIRWLLSWLILECKHLRFFFSSCN